MQEKQPKIYTRANEVELPQTIINEFARFLVPEIRKFYESEQGQHKFAEWQAKHENKEE